MKPTKKQRLWAKQFREAAKIEAKVGQSEGCCITTLQVGGRDLGDIFKEIICPNYYWYNYRFGTYWLANGVLECQKEDLWDRRDFSKREVSSVIRNQRVIALLLCAEYVLTTKIS